MTQEARRGRTWPAIRLLVSVALLVLVLGRVDMARAAQVLAGARVELIVLTVVVGWVGRAFAALRWYILVRGMNRRVSYLRLLRLTFIGMFFQFLPAGSVAVEVGRIYGMSRATSDPAASFASVLVERVLGLAALIVLALVGLALAPPGVPPLLGRLAWVGFAGLLAASWAAMSVSARGLLRRMLAAARLESVARRLGRVYERLDALRSRPDLLALSLLAALLNTTFRILPAFLLARSLQIDVSMVQLMIVVPIIVFAAQIPVSAGGLGVREVGFVALLGMIGVPASDAVVLSLLLAATILVVSLPGAWMYARGGFGDPEANDAAEAV